MLHSNSGAHIRCVRMYVPLHVHRILVDVQFHIPIFLKYTLDISVVTDNLTSMNRNKIGKFCIRIRCFQKKALFAVNQNDVNL